MLNLVISTDCDGWMLEVIHLHLDLTKMFINLVWNSQQSSYLHHYIIILPICFFVYVKFQSISFVIELQYNHVHILHMHVKPSHPEHSFFFGQHSNPSLPHPLNYMHMLTGIEYVFKANDFL